MYPSLFAKHWEYHYVNHSLSFICKEINIQMERVLKILAIIAMERMKMTAIDQNFLKWIRDIRDPSQPPLLYL